jgi:hypothetical protein
MNLPITDRLDTIIALLRSEQAERIKNEQRLEQLMELFGQVVQGSVNIDLKAVDRIVKEVRREKP